ncbi:DUF1127 domain-containing protein [Devosia nitrariae]|uniref:YjiS-like domain-containing protein n=1 Tax=Devosia nitrariae TaxID=2071872 RepID=A0ABQ5W712_9HYPH|nr:DUF1127 domain-containing protein [Devosia nitrariae]GLQ55574.1 hypothetical protein GCM10010862_28330 [Devosia nitrariae]
MTLSAREMHRHHHPAGALSGLVEWLGLNGQRGGRDRRHALTELARMADWQLEDVGLTRQRLERELATAGLRDDREQTHPGARWNRNG